MNERRARALKLEAALATFLAETEMWEDDERTIRAAIQVARRYQQGE